jgi:hypothetical protein
VLTFDILTAKPAAFRSLTGLSPSQFEDLYAVFAPAYARHPVRALATRRAGRPRRRAPGAGRRHTLDLRQRLLLTLVWLKVYPTYEVLGLLFGLHKRNAQLNARDVAEVLETLDDFPFDGRPEGRARLGTLQALLDAFPGVRLVIDSKEQRVYRPGGPHERQKPFYSGKKRAHTLKTQLGVRADGLIVALSPAVPGSVNDVRLLRQTGLLGRLGVAERALADKGYEGGGKGYAEGVLVLPKKDRKRNPCTEADRERNREIGRHRVVVEHTIAQLNRYTCLRQVWRGGKLRHSQVVRAVAVVVNRRIRQRPLKAGRLAA